MGFRRPVTGSAFGPRSLMGATSASEYPLSDDLPTGYKPVLVRNFGQPGRRPMGLLSVSSWRIARMPRRAPEGVPDRGRGGDAFPPSAALPLRNPIVDQRRSRNGCPFALASRRPSGVRGPRG